MIPVSNTTPLVHLARIGLLELLPNLYQRVAVPPAVVREARRYVGEPMAAGFEAGWLVEKACTREARVDELEAVLGGRGEAEAITLALETPDAIPCAEVLMSEATIGRVAEEGLIPGLIPLASVRGHDVVRFCGVQSVAGRRRGDGQGERRERDARQPPRVEGGPRGAGGEPPSGDRRTIPGEVERAHGGGRGPRVG